MAGTFTRGAHTMNSVFFKPTIRKYCTKGSSCGDTLREPKKLEAEEVKKKSMGGNHDGSCWVPHDRTGVYYPKGQEKIMADVPAEANKDSQVNWFSYEESYLEAESDVKCKWFPKFKLNVQFSTSI